MYIHMYYSADNIAKTKHWTPRLIFGTAHIQISEVSNEIRAVLLSHEPAPRLLVRYCTILCTAGLQSAQL